MGSRTYELALELSKDHGWAYSDTPTIVLTHRELPNERENVRFFAGGLKELVTDTLRPQYKNIWIVGGPTAGSAFLELGLVDEIRMTILPVLLGDGLPFSNSARKGMNCIFRMSRPIRPGSLN